ncbi:MULTISPECIES: hypothetical protein [Bacillus]|uniref:hypothetical protein n=1 Tax=Bacillus TaxID=1386 RepID=UPI000BB90C44|nr:MULTISPECIES: hypothetical protein [Bacillus]
MKMVNIGAFILSFICILLVFILPFPSTTLFGIHSINLILFITMINLVLGVLGFSGVQDWKGLARSVITIIVSIGLSVFLTLIIFFGSFLN